MKRKISFALAAAIAILSLTGCGDSENASDLQAEIDRLQSELDSVNSDSAMNDSETEYTSTVPSIFDNWTEEEEAETASEEYPSMFDVLPYIDVTPVSQFKYEYSGKDGGMAITEYKGTSPKVRIPDTIDGEPVVSADLGDADITELIIPDSLKKISLNKRYLKYYNITPELGITAGTQPTPNGSVESVYVEDGVTSISLVGYYNNTNLTYTIPDSVTSIDSAFCYCKYIQATFKGKTYTQDNIEDLYFSINNPDNIDGLKVKDNVLVYCVKSATDVVIPDNVTEIDKEVFSGCTGLTSVTIPDSVTYISDYAFKDCTGLTSVTIPNSVTHISDRAFKDCTGLTSVTIPNSVTYISDYAFEGCENINATYNGKTYTYDNIKELSFNINYPDNIDGLEIEDNKLVSCVKTATEVVIPDSVTRIDLDAFRGCTALTSVTISDSVTEIDDCAFADCTGLTSVTIPGSVTYFGYYAFKGCENIKVTYKGKTYTYDNIDELYDDVKNSNN